MFTPIFRGMMDKGLICRDSNIQAGYNVHVISDCVTGYDLKKIDEMLAYYTAKGCEVKTLEEYKEFHNNNGSEFFIQGLPMG